MSGMFNTKGLMILISLVLVVHFGTALVISPILAPVVIDGLNRVAGTRISVEKVNVWPVTMSLSARGIRVFDPEDQSKRMVLVERSSARLSLIGLLSRRIVFSNITISGVQLDLEGEPDGSFNIQRLTRPEKEIEPAERRKLLDEFRDKRDWFSRIYRMVRESASKKAAEEKKEQLKKSREIKKDVQPLPKGRIVRFTRPGEDFLFQVRNFSMEDSVINIVSRDAEKMSVTGANFRIRNFALDPRHGARLGSMYMGGVFEKDGENAGDFRVSYDQSFRREHLVTAIDLSARDVDLAATRFLYADSLPVSFDSGFATIESKTKITNGELDSANSLWLNDQNVVPKRGSRLTLGALPLNAICDAVNQVSPFHLRFKVSGTVENPRFEGFEEALMSVIRPYLGSMVETLRDRGIQAIGDLFSRATGADQ